MERKLSRLILDKSLNGTPFHSVLGLGMGPQNNAYVGVCNKLGVCVSVVCLACFTPVPVTFVYQSQCLSFVCGQLLVCKLNFLILRPAWLCHFPVECVFRKLHIVPRLTPVHTLLLSLLTSTADPPPPPPPSLSPPSLSPSSPGILDQGQGVLIVYESEFQLSFYSASFNCLTPINPIHNELDTYPCNTKGCFLLSHLCPD